MHATATHPWTHFGPGPYRYVGSKRKVHTSNGEGWLGSSSERAGGTCDHCGAAIMYAFQFRAANGVEFVVGSTCAERANDEFGEVEVARMQAQLRAEKKTAKVAAAKARTLAQFPDVLDLLALDSITDDWQRGAARGMSVAFAQTGKLSEKQVAWLRRMPRAS